MIYFNKIQWCNSDIFNLLTNFLLILIWPRKHLTEMCASVRDSQDRGPKGQRCCPVTLQYERYQTLYCNISFLTSVYLLSIVLQYIQCRVRSQSQPPHNVLTNLFSITTIQEEKSLLHWASHTVQNKNHFQLLIVAALLKPNVNRKNN